MKTKVKPYSLFDELVAIGCIFIIIVAVPLWYISINEQKEEVTYSQNIVKMIKKVTIDIYKDSERKDFEIFKLQQEVNKLKSDLKAYEKVDTIVKDLDRTKP